MHETKFFDLKNCYEKWTREWPTKGMMKCGFSSGCCLCFARTQLWCNKITIFIVVWKIYLFITAPATKTAVTKKPIQFVQKKRATAKANLFWIIWCNRSGAHKWIIPWMNESTALVDKIDWLSKSLKIHFIFADTEIRIESTSVFNFPLD